MIRVLPSPPLAVTGATPARGVRSLRRLAAGVALSLLVAVASAAQDAPPDPEAPDIELRERLTRLIERVKYEQQRLESLEAEFLQDKVSSLLVEPELSRGTFYYMAPERVVWEYVSPSPILILIDGKELTTWYRDLGRAERLRIQRYSDQVFRYLGASGSLETLMEYFTTTVHFPDGDGEPYRIDLEPRYPRIRKRLQSMELWIDSKLYLPVRLKYFEPNGDHTEYRFENMKVNQGIARERFELSLPADVEVKLVELQGR